MTTDSKNPPQQNEHLDLLHEDSMVGEPTPTGCGILGRYPVLSVLIFALVGIGMGVGLSYWEPDDPDDKKTALQWYVPGCLLCQGGLIDDRRCHKQSSSILVS